MLSVSLPKIVLLDLLECTLLVVGNPLFIKETFGAAKKKKQPHPRANSTNNGLFVGRLLRGSQRTFFIFMYNKNLLYAGEN